MDAKTVSVVMATYNGARYIREQLESLILQTVPPLEIIVADDGSTDGTKTIIQEIICKSPVPIRLLMHESRLGFRDNFLRAATQARGDFVAFCDQDDVWRGDKVEKCAPYFGDPTIALIVHPARTIDETGKHIGDFRQGIHGTSVKAPLSYDPWGTFWGFSITCRRDLLEITSANDRFLDYIAPEHLIAHDRWVTFLGQMVGATAEIDETLVDYRQHGNNLYGQGSRNRFAVVDDIETRNAVYSAATLQMLHTVQNMEDAITDLFPLFDKPKSIEFVLNALAQLKARQLIYDSGSRLDALRMACVAAAGGRYRGINDGKMHWRSLARDLRFVALWR